MLESTYGLWFDHVTIKVGVMVYSVDGLQEQSQQNTEESRSNHFE